ncbi:MAG: hypothetical protein D6712_03485 [Chloroflexi bacterium]|nr:MAG: hypothetical protein D6712_03485 [Chloroflexota bacterium]
MVTVSENSTTPPAASSSSKRANLKTRVITALILMPVFIILARLGSWPLLLLVAAIAVIGLMEYFYLAQGRETQGSALVGVPLGLVVIYLFYIDQPQWSLVALGVGAVATFILEQARHPTEYRRSFIQVLTTLVGVLWVAFPLGCLLAIRAWPGGAHWIFAAIGVSAGTDTLAYVGGLWIGKTPLAPVLSPKKTREGAAVGMIGGIVIPAVFLAHGGLLNATTGVMLLAGPIIAMLGDLFESAVKRYFNVKDSHLRGFNLFPGHGGVLDRIDSILFVAAYLYIYGLFAGFGG